MNNEKIYFINSIPVGHMVIHTYQISLVDTVSLASGSLFQACIGTKGDSQFNTSIVISGQTDLVLIAN